MHIFFPRAYIHSSFGERISYLRNIPLSSSPSSYRYPFLSILFSILSHIFFSSDFQCHFIQFVEKLYIAKSTMNTERICWITRFCSFFIRLGIMDATDRLWGAMSLDFLPLLCSPRGTFWNPNRSLFRFYSPLVTSRSLFVRGDNCVKILLSPLVPSLLSPSLGMTIFLPCTHFQVVLLRNFNDFRILLDP